MKITKSIFRAAIVLACVSALVSVAKAEEIHGQISDPSGAVISGARITANAKSKSVAAATTDNEGQYILIVPPGTYAIQAESPRFHPALREVTVSGGESRTVDFRLALEQVSESVTVTAGHDYQVPAADTATKTNTPLLQVPQDIAIVNHNVIEDQQDFELAGAARNVSGVARSNPVGSGQINSLFAIRGFELDYDNNYLLDGIKYPGFGASDLASVEQVEILKGPSSVLYGRAEAGGVVNLITKKPLDSRFLSLQFSGGNYSFARPEFDLSGPVNRSHTLLYRVEGDYQNGDEEAFRDFVHFHHVFVAPAFLWKPREGTSLFLQGEYLKRGNTSDDGVAAIGDRPAPVPITRFYGEPFSEAHSLDRQLGYHFHQQIGSKWSLENAFSWYRNKNYYFEVASQSVAADNRTLIRALDTFSFPENIRYSETNLIGTFSTGPIAHQVVAGLELGWTSAGFIGPTVDYPSIDIFHPIYNQLTRTQAMQLLTPSNPSYLAFGIMGNNQITGGYLQDMVGLGRVKLLAGVRVERFHQDSVNSIFNSTSRQDNSVASPRVGLVYALLNNVSLYANYSRSFIPQSPGQISKSGHSFLPEYAEQYEAGIKTSNFHSRLSSTLALFDIRKRNVLTPDSADSRFSVQTGRERSKGVDLDIVGNIATGWNVLFGYEFDQAQVTADNTFPVGNLLIDAPRHSGNLWTTYEMAKGRLHGLGFGGGLSATSRREGDLLNSFALPGYARVDTVLYYTAQESDRTSWKFSLNIKNALDRRLYETSTGPATIRPGAPFTALAAVRFTYR